MKTHLAAAAALLVAAGRSQAGLTFTWNGTGGDAFWTNGANWDGAAPPPLDLAGGNLIFGPTGAAQSPDAGLDDYSNIDSIAFTGADASLTLVGGASLIFRDLGSIINDSTSLQTVNIDITATGANFFLTAATADLVIGGTVTLNDTGGVLLTVAGDFNTTMNGLIQGIGGAVLKEGTGTLTINSNNSYDGGTELAAGTIVLGNDNALGTGTLLVSGDAAIRSDDDARTVDNDLDFVSGATLTVNGAFDLTLEGTISGGGALNVDLDADDVALTLSGVQGYSGGTTLTRGTVVLGSNSALGNGDVTLAGNASIQSNDDDRAILASFDTAGNVLTVSGGNNLELDGIISGTGSLNVNFDAAEDSLTLDFNTYSGGTTLTRGTVILESFQSLGTGDVTLAGDASVQSDNNFVAIANDFDVDAFELTIGGGNNLAVNGVISGAGSLNVAMTDAEDTLTLGGANTYSGGTTLTLGTVILADDDAFGTGGVTMAGNVTLESDDDARDVANNFDTGGSILTFAGDLDLTLSGVISGAGGLVIDAGAALRLTKENTFTGATEINAGVLILDSASVGGDVNVNDGGTLQGTNPGLGSAVAGNLTVLDGGTVAPGLSIGTLGVGGNFDLQDGATLDVEMSFDGSTALADLIDVTGTATLASGSTVRAVLDSEGYLPSGTTFEIINADGGVTDNGTNVLTDSATVTVSLIRDTDFINGDNSWGLELFRADDAYSAAAPAGNARAVGTGLDSLIPVANANPTGSAASLLARLDALQNPEYSTAVSQLSPQPYSAMNVTGQGAARDFTTQQAVYLSTVRSGIEAMPTPAPRPVSGGLALATDDPMLLSLAIAQAQAQGTEPRTMRQKEPRWGRFLKVDGVFIDQDTTADQTGFQSDGFGGQFGIDYRFSPDLVAGLAFGYSYTGADLNEGLGNLDDQALRFGPYMSWASGNWYVDGSASFAWHMYDGTRNIPALGLAAESDYDGYDFTGYLGTGYHINLDWDFYLTPIASLLYTHFHFNDFTETGAGGANLALPSRDSDSLRSRLGASLSYRFANMQWQPIPYLYAGWEHEFLDNDDLEASFAAGGNPFLVNTGTADENAFFIGGGVNMLINQNVAAFFRLESLFGDTSDAVGFSIGASVAF